VERVSLCTDDLYRVERDSSGAPGDPLWAVRDEVREVCEDDEVAIGDGEHVGDRECIDLAARTGIVATHEAPGAGLDDAERLLIRHSDDLARRGRRHAVVAAFEHADPRPSAGRRDGKDRLFGELHLAIDRGSVRERQDRRRELPVDPLQLPNFVARCELEDELDRPHREMVAAAGSTTRANANE
jgi:hypothetical protein